MAARGARNHSSIEPAGASDSADVPAVLQRSGASVVSEAAPPSAQAKPLNKPPTSKKTKKRATDGVGVMGRPPKKQHSPTTLEEKEEAQLFAGWDDYQENEEENKASDFRVVENVGISIDELAQATAEDLMGIFLADE